MKTITKEINLYTYDELSDKAKEKARNDYNEEDGLSWLPEDLTYKAQELLKDNKIDGEITKVYYSLSYCQGDGAMFEGNFRWKDYTVKIYHTGNYYHENSKNIIILNSENEPVDDYGNEFNNIYVRICKELAKYGYDCIETSQSEENLKDLFNANDYTFTSDGEMYNE